MASTGEKHSEGDPEPPTPDLGTSGTSTEMISDSGQDYISGMRLFAVTASVTLVGFLMLLDMSIIATVCHFLLANVQRSRNCAVQHYPEAAFIGHSS